MIGIGTAKKGEQAKTGPHEREHQDHCDGLAEEVDSRNPAQPQARDQGGRKDQVDAPEHEPDARQDGSHDERSLVARSGRERGCKHDLLPRRVPGACPGDRR